MKKKLPMLLLLLVSVCVFVYSGTQLFSYFRRNRLSQKVAEEAFDAAVTLAEPEIAEKEEDGQAVADSSGSVDSLQEIAPLRVDFLSLRQQNQDVVAWLYSPGTYINYPVVQGVDNQYYVNRILNGYDDGCGTLFVDYRNTPGFTDFNTIIYGHDMQSGIMFGQLDYYKEQEYFDQHPRMYLITPSKSYRVDLIWGYITPRDSFVYAPLSLLSEKEQLLKEASEGSTFDSGLTAGTEDHLLLLSTCTYEYEGARYILVGRLTEILPLPED